MQLYSCEVGQGRLGRAFVRQLSEMMGAHVAAASRPVGHVDRGGDWCLDVGVLRSPALQLPQWPGLLGLTVTPLTLSYLGRSLSEHRNSSAFAALRSDGSVVTWGYSTYGGDSSAVTSALNGTNDVTQVFSTESAFAALRIDGSVVTWGDGDYGGDSNAVANALNGSVDVTQVFSTAWAFAALRSDGSVVTWGDPSWGNHGGDSNAVASALNGTIDVTHVFSNNYLISKLRQLAPLNHDSECGLELIAANSNRCGNKSKLNRLLKR